MPLSATASGSSGAPSTPGRDATERPVGPHEGTAGSRRGQVVPRGRVRCTARSSRARGRGTRRPPRRRRRAAPTLRPGRRLILPPTRSAAVEHDEVAALPVEFVGRGEAGDAAHRRSRGDRSRPLGPLGVDWVGSLRSPRCRWVGYRRSPRCRRVGYRRSPRCRRVGYRRSPRCRWVGYLRSPRCRWVGYRRSPRCARRGRPRSGRRGRPRASRRGPG